MTNLLQELGVMIGPSKTMRLQKFLVRFLRSHILVFLAVMFFLPLNFSKKLLCSLNFFARLRKSQSTDLFVSLYI